MGGIGVCEDSIYCSQYIECNCGQQLDISTCKDILCNFWENNAIDITGQNNLINKNLGVGSCYAGLATDDQDLFWSKVIFGIPDPTVDSALSCGTPSATT